MQLTSQHDPEGGLWRVCNRERLLVEYLYRNDTDPAPSFRTVVTLQGVPVALYRPWDHLWHVGLFFNWKYINGINFWESHFQSEEPAGRSISLSFHEVQDGSGLGFRQELTWEANGRALMKEQRSVTLAQAEGGYLLSHTSEFSSASERAMLDVTKVTPERPGGGYAGFSCRLARNFLRPTITTSQGVYNPSHFHGTSAAWCDYSGRVDGFRDVWAGVTLMDHPDNPRHPSPMLTYDTRIQFLQAGFLYREPYILTQGESLRLRYQAYIHDGKADVEQIASLWSSFSAT